MPKKIALAVFLVLTVLWTAFIFANSLEDAAASSNKSSAVTEVVNKVASSVGIQDEIPHRTVRNMAHFAEFMLLGALLYADSMLVFSIKRAKSSLFFLCPASTVVACFLLACVDELLQKLSEGRASQMSDVLLDTLGALCATAAITLIVLISYYLRLLIKRKKADSHLDKPQV